MTGAISHILLAVMVLTTSFLTVTSSDEPAIIFRYADAYEQTYDDRGTKGDESCALWRPLVFQKGYCALGDVYSDIREGMVFPAPKKTTVLVKAGNDGDAVVHPTSFTEVWNDHGSKGEKAVTVYKMNAPQGYSCIGGATVGDYSTLPDKNHYCCVKNEYLVEGQYHRVYTDKGTGAYTALSLWEVVQGADPSSVVSSVIVPTGNSGYNQPSETPYLLKFDEDHVNVIWSVENPPKTPLYLYEATDKLEHVWWDVGSKGHYPTTIFRATSDPENGYYSVTDVAVPYYNNNNLAFLLKTADRNDRKSFSTPVSYTKIWSLNSADEYVRIWRPTCAADYVSLGYVATSTGSNDPPEAGKIYCIHSDYVTYGDKTKNFKRVWINSGVPGPWVQLFEAVAHEKVEQGLRAMFAEPSEDGLPLNPYFLKTGHFTHIAEKPVVKVEVYDVDYQLDSEEKVTEPDSIMVTYVINKSDLEQKCLRTIEFTTTKTSSFTFSSSVSFGISTEVTAKVPLFAETTTTLSSETTIGFESGEETSEEKTDSITAEILVPSKKKTKATISGIQYTTDIPYTATVKKTYFDGTEGYSKTAGIFNGVEVSEVTVTYGETVDLTQEDWDSDEDDSPQGQ